MRMPTTQDTGAQEENDDKTQAPFIFTTGREEEVGILQFKNKRVIPVHDEREGGEDNQIETWEKGAGT